MNNLAVITGASSGIGAEFARQLAPDHQSLWLIGRREEKLEQLAADLRSKYKVEARVMLRDLSDEAVINQIAQELEEQTELRTLINNAGYARDGEFHQLGWQVHKELMNVHVDATLKLTHSALKPMSANNRGSIINVSSVASFFPTPLSPLYAPTKVFIRNFSETLAVKYKERNINIQALCPGFTVTDFHEKLGLDPKSFYKKKGLQKAWSAEYVVRESLGDLEKGRVVSVPGWNYKLIVMLIPRLPMSWLLHMTTRSEESKRYSE